MLKYIWIEEYKNIKKTGFNFSNKEKFIFSEKKDFDREHTLAGVLSVVSNDMYNVFPSTISSISVVVGENGAGKSSLLEYIYEALFRQYYNFRGIVVIDNFIIINKDMDVTPLELKGYEVLKSIDELERIKIKNGGESLSIIDAVTTDTWVFSYSPFFNFDRISHFEGYSGENERFENGKLFDISNIGQLVSDYNNNFQFINKDDLSTINPLINHRSLESLRYLDYLINYKESVLFKNNINKVKFAFNDYYVNYWEKIAEMFNDSNIGSGTLVSDFNSNYENRFEDNYYKSIFFFLLNVLKDILQNRKTKFNAYLDTFKYCKYILKLDNIRDYKSAVIFLLKEAKLISLDFSVFDDIFNLIKPLNTSNFDSFDINYTDKETLQAIFISLYKNEKFIIYDVHYLMNIFNIDFIGLSSGEKTFLSLFSRLESVNNNLKRYYSTIKNKKIIMFLDEPEIGLHPQWQKEYISKLLEYTETTLGDYKEIQIILTTHSPILLSDVPSQHIIYLKKNDDGMCEIVEKKKETFGSSIYDLYNSSFFLQDGFIGTFAQKYINQLIESIDKLTPSTILQEIDELKNKIGIVGEELIRSSLEDFLFEKVKTPQNEIDVLKKRVKELESKVKMYEENQNK